jgi:hypothetical protein
MRHFKTKGGRKKHWNASHPTFGPATTTTTTPCHATNTVEDAEPTDVELDHELPEPTTPVLDNLDAEFWGPGDKLYRNYHPRLNGSVFVNFPLSVTQYQFKHALVMKQGNS